LFTLPSKTRIHTSRGNLGEASAALGVASSWRNTPDLQDRALLLVGEAIVHRAEGSFNEALTAGREAFEAGRKAAAFFYANEGFIEAVEAAFGLDDFATIEELLAFHEGLPPVERPESLEAHRARFRARLAARRDERDYVEPSFKQAVASFHELRVPFWLAVSGLEYAEWLASEGRHDEAESLLGEARGIFERLQAEPWLERLAHAGTPLGAPAS
jgi:tetratricopeptide (TPR) repeat protein